MQWVCLKRSNWELEKSRTEIEDRECDGIQDAHIYEFRLEITMNKCTNEGDISIAVGVHGQDTVTGVYITPLCGCECEKLQRHVGIYS